MYVVCCSYFDTFTNELWCEPFGLFITETDAVNTGVEILATWKKTLTEDYEDEDYVNSRFIFDTRIKEIKNIISE